jgi:hypothetical protein
MLGGALLGHSPLVSTLFANLAIKESLEPTPNPTTSNQWKFFIHLFSLLVNRSYDEKFSGSVVSPILNVSNLIGRPDVLAVATVVK